MKPEYEPLKLLNCLGEQMHKQINAANFNSVNLGSNRKKLNTREIWQGRVGTDELW